MTCPCCTPFGSSAAPGGGGGLVAYVRQANIADGVTVPSAATLNQMLALAAAAADYVLSSDGRFSLGANCVLTYTGPTIQALVRQTFCGFTTGVIAFEYAATAHNADLVGNAATNNNAAMVAAGAANDEVGAGDSGAVLTSVRLLTLADGDTLQPVAGLQVGAGASDITVMFLELDVSEVSPALA